jgi:membrane protein
VRSGLKEAGRDNLDLAAAGVAFYGFLALVPLLQSAVLLYGLVVDPATVTHHVSAMAQVLPDSVTGIVRKQLQAIVAGPQIGKGFGFVVSLAVALFFARNGAAALIAALGIAYDREDDRSLLRRTVLAIVVTLAGLAGLGVLSFASFVLSSVGSLLPGSGLSPTAYRIATYAILLLAGMAGAGLLYRFGPNRAEPRWQLVSIGSVFAGLGLVILSLGLGIYVVKIASYHVIYGSLSAIVVFLLFLYCSAFVLLLGAEFNAAARRRVGPGEGGGGGRKASSWDPPPGNEM